MTLGAVKAGDIVLADRKGRRFFAVVTARRERELEVEPIDRRVTYHVVKARGDRDLAQEPATNRPLREYTAGRGVSGPAPICADREQLLIVRVADQINPTLAGRAGASYDSPPQPPEQALTLVRLLLGWSTEPLVGQTRWRCAVAGGTRTVTLDTVEMTANVRAARTASGESARPGPLRRRPALRFGAA